MSLLNFSFCHHSLNKYYQNIYLLPSGEIDNGMFICINLFIPLSMYLFIVYLFTYIYTAIYKSILGFLWKYLNYLSLANIITLKINILIISHHEKLCGPSFYLKVAISFVNSNLLISISPYCTPVAFYINGRKEEIGVEY
jgi:hypothetical protein